MAKQNLNLKRLPGFILVLVFVIFSLSGLSMFEQLERALLDNNMRLTFSEQKGSHDIVLIEIDGKSLKEIGPWPWPRLVIAEMIQSLTQASEPLASQSS